MRNKLRNTRSATRVAMATVVLLAFSMFAVAPAHAETSSPRPDVEVRAGSSLTPEVEAGIAALVDASDRENRIFDATAAADAGVPQSEIADFSYVVAANGWEITGTQDVDQLMRSASDNLVTTYDAKACTGKSGYTGYWGWGWQWALNSCQTTALIAAIAAGAGAGAFGAASAILVAIPPAAPAAAITFAVGAVVGAGGLFLGACQAASYGVYATYLNISNAGVPGCWGQ